MAPKGHLRRFALIYAVVMAVSLGVEALAHFGNVGIPAWISWAPLLVFPLLVYGAATWLMQNRKAIPVSERGQLATAYGLLAACITFALALAYDLLVGVLFGLQSQADFRDRFLGALIFAVLFGLVARLMIGLAAGRASPSSSDQDV